MPDTLLGTDVDEIEAKLENGILEVVIPKPESHLKTARMVRIPIQ
jgi:HSP20 family molecular chaperone IbpA